MMRQINTKFDGTCARCNAEIETGEPAMYEKSMGIFCIGCEPTEVEDIREFRLATAERKAARYDDWATKREVKATAQLNSHPTLRSDIAFNTQPGHIPLRARMIKADDKAFESLDKAESMRNKAESLRNVRVAGDAERQRQQIREKLDTIIQKGTIVYDAVFGTGEVVGVYKKSYRIKFREDFIISRDKSFVRPTAKEKE